MMVGGKVLAIEAQPVPLGVDGDGVVRVRGSRVTLDTIVAAFLRRATAEEIQQHYPTVALADVYAVIAYYLRSQSDVEAYLRQRREQATRVRVENEFRFSPAGMRARLLARRNSLPASPDAPAADDVNRA